MNQLLADNKVSTFRTYLLEKIGKHYSERESLIITNILFNHFQGWDRVELQNRRDDRLSESEILQLHFALKRIILGEPIQYITKQTWFFGLTLTVSPGALIPRPETEELVQLILDGLTAPSPKILDIGTGSGCIALALKASKPEAIVTAIDISDDALAIAGTNAEKLNLDIEIIKADLLKPPSITGPFDVIVSNPPYVLESDKTSMDERVLNHEPHLALFVPDTDPLKFYRNIVSWSRSLLNPEGFVACEMHESMEILMKEMLLENGITSFSFHQDSQEKSRFVHFNFSTL